MNILQLIKNAFKSLNIFRKKDSTPEIEVMAVTDVKIEDKAFLEWRDDQIHHPKSFRERAQDEYVAARNSGLVTPAIIPGTTLEEDPTIKMYRDHGVTGNPYSLDEAMSKPAPERSDIKIDTPTDEKAHRDPMVKIYQDIRHDLGHEPISDSEALAKLLERSRKNAAELTNRFVDEMISDISPVLVETSKPLEAPVLGNHQDLVSQAQEKKDRFIDMVFEPNQPGTTHRFVSPSRNNFSMRAVPVITVEDTKPFFVERVPKKLTRSEKKRQKHEKQRANLALNRNAIAEENARIEKAAAIQVQQTESIKLHNLSYNDVIDGLDNNEAVFDRNEPGTEESPIPLVSEVMGENYGPVKRWLHKDDQFIEFKILTRIVVSDPHFFSQYMLRTLPVQQLNEYSADYAECFATIEELAPVIDLNALAIMDEEHYCILVAFQNVFGMLIVNQDDAIDMKRRGAGLEDDHPTGYYHMTFMRWDDKAVKRMDLVGKDEIGYAEQIPHFKVNFAKFNHSEKE